MQQMEWVQLLHWQLRSLTIGSSFLLISFFAFLSFVLLSLSLSLSLSHTHTHTFILFFVGSVCLSFTKVGSDVFIWQYTKPVHHLPTPSFPPNLSSTLLSAQPREMSQGRQVILRFISRWLFPLDLIPQNWQTFRLICCLTSVPAPFPLLPPTYFGNDYTCCQSEIEDGNQTFYLTQLQYADNALILLDQTPGWVSTRESVIQITGMTRPGKCPLEKRGSNPGMPLDLWATENVTRWSLRAL